MLDTEFFKKKNEIIEKVTGKALVPESQIEEVVHKEELIPHTDTATGFLTLRAAVCPYCITYYYNWNDGRGYVRSEDGTDPLPEAESNCPECPMQKAGNGCLEHESSWYHTSVLWNENCTKEDSDSLLELIKRYNKENGFG